MFSSDHTCDRERCSAHTSTSPPAARVRSGVCEWNDVMLMQKAPCGVCVCVCVCVCECVCECVRVCVCVSQNGLCEWFLLLWASKFTKKIVQIWSFLSLRARMLRIKRVRTMQKLFTKNR